MPSLMRIARKLALTALAAYACMLGLANLVGPQQHEIKTTVALHPRTLQPGEPRAAKLATATRPADGTQLLTTLEGLPFPRE
jgi:hypothetical protein